MQHFTIIDVNVPGCMNCPSASCQQHILVVIKRYSVPVGKRSASGLDESCLPTFPSHHLTLLYPSHFSLATGPLWWEGPPVFLFFFFFPSTKTMNAPNLSQILSFPSWSHLISSLILFVAVGIVSGASCMLGKPSITELHP